MGVCKEEVFDLMKEKVMKGGLKEGAGEDV